MPSLLDRSRILALALSMAQTLRQRNPRFYWRNTALRLLSHRGAEFPVYSVRSGAQGWVNRRHYEALLVLASCEGAAQGL